MVVLVVARVDVDLVHAVCLHTKFCDKSLNAKVVSRVDVDLVTLSVYTQNSRIRVVARMGCLFQAVCL